MMTGPAPTADELATILTVASRVPDHGKLAPWRFVVLEGGARERAGALALAIAFENRPDLDDGIAWPQSCSIPIPACGLTRTRLPEINSIGPSCCREH